MTPASPRSFQVPVAASGCIWDGQSLLAVSRRRQPDTAGPGDGVSHRQKRNEIPGHPQDAHADSNEETEQLADRIEGVAGEFSPFEELHGFRIDGVDLTTSALPEGWRDRLVKVQNANTAAVTGELQFTGWCLDKEDLCVAKLCALREKDQNFVSELLRAGLVDSVVIATRLTTVPERYQLNAERASEWLASWR